MLVHLLVRKDVESSVQTLYLAVLTDRVGPSRLRQLVHDNVSVSVDILHFLGYFLTLLLVYHLVLLDEFLFVDDYLGVEQVLDHAFRVLLTFRQFVQLPFRLQIEFFGFSSVLYLCHFFVFVVVFTVERVVNVLLVVNSYFFYFEIVLFFHDTCFMVFLVVVADNILFSHYFGFRHDNIEFV